MLESYLLILYRLIFNDFFKISPLLSLLSYRSYNFIKFEEIKWANPVPWIFPVPLIPFLSYLGLYKRRFFIIFLRFEVGWLIDGV